MLYTLLALYISYIGFAFSVSVYRLWQKGALNLFNKIMFAPLLLIFIVLDVVANYTLFILVMGLPPKNCYTITDRLTVYNSGRHGWRTKVANIICEKLLDTVDPTGNHC